MNTGIYIRRCLGINWRDEGQIDASNSEM